MGTTLQNGVYLPNEGERNCYAGLKTNWEILDQKVADVTALQQAVAGALHREIVESLPTTDIDPNTIYMILSGTSATENVYNEYMYVNNAWELIGTSATDLTNYYTKAEVDGKLLLKASASDLTSHTGDTTIHVTTADKNKWNNQTYVFRYSSTALVASSTNSNALLDNTDNLKVGDKVIDSSGVLFSITAIDTANSTFTIGTALIDLAQDSDVVHKSGDETVGGKKTFTGEITNNISNKANASITLKNSLYDPKTNGQSNVNTCSFSIGFNTLTDDGFAYISAYGTPDYSMLRLTTTYFTNSENSITDSIEYKIYQNGDRSLRPRNNNNTMLGESTRKWKEVYATNYYYGSNNVEFSTKFVTTDTAQTISGTKTFTDNNMIKTSSPKVLLINTSQTGNTPPSSNTASFFRFDGGTVNNFGGLQCEFLTTGENRLTNYVKDITLAKLNSIQQRVKSTTAMTVFNADLLTPATDGITALGSSSKRWSDVQTYKVNGLTPSSLSLPSNTGYIDISSYFTNTGDGQTNSYTASANGWIYLNVVATRLVMQIRDSNDNNIYADMRVRSSDGTIYMTIPIGSGNKLLTQWFTSSSVTVTTARFIPCQGNV